MPKTVIFANGCPMEEPPVDDLIHPEDTVICADGGAVHALSLGIIPNIVIGDCDSLPKGTTDDLRARGVQIIKKPSKKNETDLELAVQLAVARGASRILVLTALGGRMDQSLANILLLAKPEWQPIRIELAEGKQAAVLIRGPDEIEIAGDKGDIFSLIPLSEVLNGVTLEGLEWPAKDSVFHLGSTEPISNSFTGEKALVRIDSGTALIVHIPKIAAR